MVIFVISDAVTRINAGGKTRITAILINIKRAVIHYHLSEGLLYIQIIKWRLVISDSRNIFIQIFTTYLLIGYLTNKLPTIFFCRCS